MVSGNRWEEKVVDMVYGNIQYTIWEYFIACQGQSRLVAILQYLHEAKYSYEAQYSYETHYSLLASHPRREAGKLSLLVESDIF